MEDNVNPLFEHFKDVPMLNVSPILMKNPNDTIPIYQGEFSLRREQILVSLRGTIFFKWFPYMGVKLKGSITDGNHSLEIDEDYELIFNGNNIGLVTIVEYSDHDTPSCSGDAKHFIWGEKAIPVNEVTFSIPNMREFLGNSVKEVTAKGIALKKSRLILEDKPYKIEIDRLSDYEERRNKLENNGGYLITYAGRITKKKGAISLAELHDWHQRFHHFLYFLNGRRVAPMFYTGIHDGRNIWTDYGGYNVDSYKFVMCWSDIIFLGDLPQLWKSYNKLWKNENDRDFLITVIHWYIEANSHAGRVEGSIILIQTALELIYNWLIVEHQKIIIGNDAENMSAANKIRLIIHQLRICSAVPSSLTELAALPDLKDGPEALVKIRNGLVHGQEVKRAELKKINLKAKYEVLQLGIWYVELALLYILDYKGNYNSRTDGHVWRNTGVLVPWENDQSFKFGTPLDFTEEEICAFVELLEKQNKVQDPTASKVRRCKFIGMGFSWGKPVAIGAIKKKTPGDFEEAKANLPGRAKEFEWEVGYFYTEPKFEGRKFSSTILNNLLKDFGNGKLMATTEIRDENRMVESLERRGFKQVGATWKSVKSGNDLRLFIRDLPEQPNSSKMFKRTV